MPATTARKPKSTRTRARAPERRPASNRLMQPEDLLKFIFLSDVQISPDGGRILLVHKHI